MVQVRLLVRLMRTQLQSKIHFVHAVLAVVLLARHSNLEADRIFAERKFAVSIAVLLDINAQIVHCSRMRKILAKLQTSVFSVLASLHAADIAVIIAALFVEDFADLAEALSTLVTSATLTLLRKIQTHKLCDDSKLEDEEELDELAYDLASQSFMIEYKASNTVASCSDVGSKSMFVSGQINAVQAKYILIDTGSTVTLITEILWQACRTETDKIVPVDGRFMTANGSNLKVLGKTKVRIRVAGIDTWHTVIVAKNLAQHIILGNDFLSANQCDLLLRVRQMCTPFGRTQIRFENKVIRVNSIFFVAQSPTESKERQYAILANDTSVCASSEQFVDCKIVNAQLDKQCRILSKSPVDNVVFVIEPNHVFEAKYDLLVTPSAHIKAPTLKVRLTNHLPTDINVPKGTRIGAITKVIAESDAPQGQNTNIKHEINAVCKDIANSEVSECHKTQINRCAARNYPHSSQDARNRLSTLYHARQIAQVQGSSNVGNDTSAPDLVRHPLNSAANAPAEPSDRTAEVEKCIQVTMSTLPKTLNCNQRAEFAALLRKFPDIISIGPHDCGCTPLAKLAINTGNAAPIKQAPRRLPYHQMPLVSAEIDKLEQMKIIRPSNSSWASPILIVAKRNHNGEITGIRMCIDYRKLNAVTVKDAFPLPRIDDILDALSGSTVFSSCDLMSGYFNILVENDSIAKTSFVTPFGQWEYLRMPFGVCNGPSVFQRLMSACLHGLLGTVACAYLDDVIIFSGTWEEHLARLETVFLRFRDAKLKLKLDKCSFCMPEVQFLGHVVDSRGIRPDPSKTKKVSEWPTPANLDEVRSFLGLSTYYRRFVNNFAAVAKPLVRLMEKDVKFEWNSECEKAFKELKHLLTTAPVLAYPNFNEPFILETDASRFAIGGVLTQKGKDNQEHPVCYYSRTLSKPEQNYSTTRQEMLGAVDSMKHFRTYLLGKKFTLRTDHAALKYLQTMHEPTGQAARWLESLASFDFDVVHRPGAQNSNADALSRYPIRAIQFAGNATEYSVDDIAAMQEEDNDIAYARKWVVDGNRPTDDEMNGYSQEARWLWSKFALLKMENGILYMQQPTHDGSALERVTVVPKALRQRIMETAHSKPGSGHIGRAKMLAKLKERFAWYKMADSVLWYVRTCDACSTRKSSRRNHAPLQSIKTGWPFMRIGLDYVGPLPTSSAGNRFILVVIDFFTRWVEAFPTKHIDAATTAKLLVTEVFSRFSVPYIIHTDQGGCFESALLKEICDLFDVARTRTTPYHPACNGMTERVNQTIIQMLATSIDGSVRDWDRRLDFQLFAYRTTVHKSTGFSPFELLFGHRPRIPLDCIVPTPDDAEILATNDLTAAQEYHRELARAYEIARENMGLAQRRSESVYDRKCFGKRFEVGQSIWLHLRRTSNGSFQEVLAPMGIRENNRKDIGHRLENSIGWQFQEENSNCAF